MSNSGTLRAIGLMAAALVLLGTWLVIVAVLEGRGVPQLLYLNFVAAVLDNAGDTQFPHQPQPCTIPSPSSSAQCTTTNPMIDGSLGSRCRRQRAGRRERQRRVGRWELIMPHSVERHHGLGSRTRPLRDYRRECIMASTATAYCSALFIVASTRTQLET